MQSDLNTNSSSISGPNKFHGCAFPELSWPVAIDHAITIQSNPLKCEFVNYGSCSSSWQYPLQVRVLDSREETEPATLWKQPTDGTGYMPLYAKAKKDIGGRLAQISPPRNLSEIENSGNIQVSSFEFRAPLPGCGINGLMIRLVLQ